MCTQRTFIPHESMASRRQPFFKKRTVSMTNSFNFADDQMGSIGVHVDNPETVFIHRVVNIVVWLVVEPDIAIRLIAQLQIHSTWLISSQNLLNVISRGRKTSLAAESFFHKNICKLRELG